MRWLLLLLKILERGHCLVHEPMKCNRNDDDEDDHKDQPDAQMYERRFLFSFDSGDDRCAALGTRPRMVADLSAAFVAFDEGHKLRSRNLQFLRAVNPFNGNAG